MVVQEGGVVLLCDEFEEVEQALGVGELPTEVGLAGLQPGQEDLLAQLLMEGVEEQGALGVEQVPPGEVGFAAILELDVVGQGSNWAHSRYP